MMVFLNDFFYILPEIFLLSTALLYLFVGIIYVREEKALNKFPRLVNSLFVSFLFILFFTFILVVLIPANYSIFNNMLVSTEYVKIAKLVLLVLAASSHLFSMMFLIKSVRSLLSNLFCFYFP